MRSVKFAELLAASALNIQRLKVLRQRRQVALAFGRSDCYESLGYVELDAVAALLADALTDKLDRDLAVEIVLDQWGTWARVVALAEKIRPAPAFFYVIGYEDAKGRRGNLTLGSRLDSRERENLVAIAADIQKRFSVAARDFVVVEMASILADARRNAKAKGYDFSDKFLPVWGDPKLEEILRPFDETRPDRAIVITEREKDNVAEDARRAGIMARAIVEAKLPAASPRGRA